MGGALKMQVTANPKLPPGLICYNWETFPVPAQVQAHANT